MPFVVQEHVHSLYRHQWFTIHMYIHQRACKPGLVCTELTCMCPQANHNAHVRT